MAGFEAGAAAFVGFAFAFAGRGAGDALLAEADELDLIAFFGKDGVGFFRVAGGSLGLVVAGEPLTPILDGHRWLSGDRGHCERGADVCTGVADGAGADGEDVTDSVVGAAGHDGGGCADGAATSDDDVSGGTLAGADACCGGAGGQNQGGLCVLCERRAAGCDRQGGNRVALGVEVVDAVAGQGEGDLGDVAGGDVLGEVADLGEAGVDFGVVAGGVSYGGLAVPLQQGAGGGIDGGFLEDLVATVGDVEVHRAGDAVALAGDEVGLESLLGVVVDDCGGLGGALDARVVQRQDAGHAGRGGRDGAGRSAQLHEHLVAEASEKGAGSHAQSAIVYNLVCPC